MGFFADSRRLRGGWRLTAAIVAGLAVAAPARADELDLRATATVERLADALASHQACDGHWQGTFESDPTFDALLAVLGKRLGYDVTALTDDALARARSWRVAPQGWPNRPGSAVDLDTTGTLLLALQALGHDRSDPDLVAAWSWFDTQGGSRKLNFLNIMSLAPLGLVDATEVPELSPLAFGVPEASPVNLHTLGIFRSMIVPLTVWQFYGQTLIVRPLDPARVASAGARFTQPLPDPPTFFPTNYWAQEGLGWILSRQQEDGPWYTLNMSIVSLLALKQAQDRGVGDFHEQLDRGWRGLLAWRRPAPGDPTHAIVQPSLSTGWDTSRALLAFNALPEVLRTASAVSVQAGRDWLTVHQLAVKGDWAYQKPDLEPGAWSFVPENPFLPDTDVSAASLEALAETQGGAAPDAAEAAALARGTAWLIGMQNVNGGFSAWERGDVKQVMELLQLAMTRPVPSLSDTGQPDVTARVLKALVAARKNPTLANDALAPAIAKACGFLTSSRLADDRWEGDWLVAYLYGTAEVTDALLTAGCETPEQAAPRLAWIAAQQNADGGWGEDATAFVEKHYVAGASTVMQSSFALHALMTYDALVRAETGAASAYAPVIERGASFLVDRAAATPIEERAHVAVLWKGIWYANYDLGPTYETMRALSRFLKGRAP